MNFAFPSVKRLWAPQKLMLALLPGAVVSSYGLFIRTQSYHQYTELLVALFLSATLIWAAALVTLWGLAPSLTPRQPLQRGLTLLGVGILYIGAFSLTICALPMLFRQGSIDIIRLMEILGVYLQTHAVTLVACYCASAAIILLLHSNPKYSAQEPAPALASMGAGTKACNENPGLPDIQISVGMIRWIEAMDNYAVVHGVGQKQTIRASLASLEQELNDEGFVRVHRKAIVNKKYVREVRVHGSAYEALLDNGAAVPVARRRRQKIN